MPFFVRCGQSTGDLNCRSQSLCATGSGPARKQLPERAAVQQLRHDVRRAFKRAEAVNRKNVGMIQRRSGLRLLLKSAQPVVIL